MFVRVALVRDAEGLAAIRRFAAGVSHRPATLSKLTPVLVMTRKQKKLLIGYDVKDSSVLEGKFFKLGESKGLTIHEKTDRIYENMMARFSSLEKQLVAR